MTQPAKAQEPSMEEILASIRRIIADDDAGQAQAEQEAEQEPAKPTAVTSSPPEPPPEPAPTPEPAAMTQDDIDAMLSSFEQPTAGAAAPPAPPEHEADILDLTEAMASPPSEPETAEEDTPSFQTIGGESDVVFVEAPPPEPEPLPEPLPEPVAQVPPEYATSGMQTLLGAAPMPMESPIMSAATTAAVDAAFNSLAQTVLMQNAKTLDDVVQELLRPMLKTWLDDNLPNLVERMVRAEIERVSRGRG